MPYQHTTWEGLRNGLAFRLDDAKRIFWTDEELGIYLIEALRTFGLLTGFWRERGTFPLIPYNEYYLLNTSAGLPNLLGFTVTDFDLIKQLQYHLLETKATVSQSTWFGTEMFTLADLVGAIERRRDQFLQETGLVLTVESFSALSPSIGRQILSDNIIDVRRVVWQGVVPIDYYQDLRREDEYALTAYQQTWAIDTDKPRAWSVLGPPPLQLQLAPPPMDVGYVWLTTVNTGPQFFAGGPLGIATGLGVPDDLTPAIKWGALADLLGKDGVCRDAERSAYCEQRYQQFVELARLLPVVLHTEINGVPVLPTTLAELDSFDPGWQNRPGRPTDVVIEGGNLVWVYPKPDDEDFYSITMDVVRRTPLPASDIDMIVLGREQLDAVLDYAEHLAVFKIAGVEWRSSQPQADNFLSQCVSYNRRLSAAARYVFTPQKSSQRNETVNARQRPSDGVGVLSGREQSNA